ncbi:MAG: threonine ammonia-lyase [Pseudomonadota bacterium]
MSTVTFADVEAAAGRIAGQAVRTPLLESLALNERLGRRVLVKPEVLQRVGAFKFRGAYNRLVQLDADARARGVVAFSSGNHAQGVALAAKMLGIAATIVMPHDAPAKKVEATKGLGATVRIYDRYAEDRAAIAAEIAGGTGATIVPPYDDPHIVAGQGTVGLELMADAAALGVDLPAVVCPLGGGGLLSGVGLAVKALSPRTAVIGAEPEGYDDVRRSLLSGAVETNSPDARTICDALQTPSPGRITFPILQRVVADVAVITDAEAAEAVRVAAGTLQLVVEPGGAAGLAALLAGKVGAGGDAVGVVLSGGNIDPGLYARILAREL